MISIVPDFATALLSVIFGVGSNTLVERKRGDRLIIIVPRLVWCPSVDETKLMFALSCMYVQTETRVRNLTH